MNTSHHLPLRFIVVTAVVLAAFFFLFKTLFLNTSATKNTKASELATPQSTCRVSGQVLLLPPEVRSCVTEGGAAGQQVTGVNNMRVFLTGYDVQNRPFSTETRTFHYDGVNRDGVFHLENVPMGIFNICADSGPAGLNHFCNYPRVDGHDLYNTTCAKIDTRTSCLGVRLDLTRQLNPTNTPIQPPTPWPTNTPIIPPTNYPRPTNTPVQPPTPRPTNTPIPAPTTRPTNTPVPLP